MQTLNMVMALLCGVAVAGILIIGGVVAHDVVYNCHHILSSCK